VTDKVTQCDIKWHCEMMNSKLLYSSVSNYLSLHLTTWRGIQGMVARFT